MNSFEDDDDFYSASSQSSSSGSTSSSNSSSPHSDHWNDIELSEMQKLSEMQIMTTSKFPRSITIPSCPSVTTSSCPSVSSSSTAININDIDDYSLLLIFAKLNTMEKMSAQAVCRRWYSLINKLLFSQASLGISVSCANCPDLRHQVSSHECIGMMFANAIIGSNKWYFIKPSQLSMILSKCPNLKSLDMQSCIFGREVLKVIESHCPQTLEHVDLSFSSCNVNEIVQNISEKCSQKLKHLMLKDNEINELGLKNVIENCQHLEVLVLDKNEQITGQCFNCFGECIKSLSIAECANIGDDGINALVAGNGKNVTNIKLGSSVTPNMLRIICENMQQLKSLEMDGFNTETPNVYACIRQLTSLEEMILSIPRIAFDVPLIEIISKCHELKKVKIDGGIITNTSLVQFSRHCPLIEQISISPKDSATNNLITDECRFEISSLQNLRTLSLSNSFITDVFVESVRFCTRLCFLELDGCKFITNNMLDSCVQMALNRPNDKIMLFIHRTKISKPLTEMPPNLNVFGGWGNNKSE